MPAQGTAISRCTSELNLASRKRDSDLRDLDRDARRLPASYELYALLLTSAPDSAGPRARKAYRDLQNWLAHEPALDDVATLRAFDPLWSSTQGRHMIYALEGKFFRQPSPLRARASQRELVQQARDRAAAQAVMELRRKSA
ncbi:hypothetical protein ACWD25_28695 [Streptomyces sp. NPDC002920]